MSDSDEVECPVCNRHSAIQAADSQGLLLTGMQAVLDRDKEQIEAVFSQLTAWDAHCAITMLLYFISDLCAVLGQDLRESLAEMRQQVTDAQAQSA